MEFEITSNKPYGRAGFCMVLVLLNMIIFCYHYQHLYTLTNKYVHALNGNLSAICKCIEKDVPTHILNIPLVHNTIQHIKYEYKIVAYDKQEFKPLRLLLFKHSDKDTAFFQEFIQMLELNEHFIHKQKAFSPLMEWCSQSLNALMRKKFTGFSTNKENMLDRKFLDADRNKVMKDYTAVNRVVKEFENRAGHEKMPEEKMIGNRVNLRIGDRIIPVRVVDGVLVLDKLVPSDLILVYNREISKSYIDEERLNQIEALKQAVSERMNEVSELKSQLAAARDTEVKLQERNNELGIKVQSLGAEIREKDKLAKKHWRIITELKSTLEGNISASEGEDEIQPEKMQDFIIKKYGKKKEQIKELQLREIENLKSFEEQSKLLNLYKPYYDLTYDIPVIPQILNHRRDFPQHNIVVDQNFKNTQKDDAYFTDLVNNFDVNIHYHLLKLEACSWQCLSETKYCEYNGKRVQLGELTVAALITNRNILNVTFEQIDIMVKKVSDPELKKLIFRGLPLLKILGQKLGSPDLKYIIKSRYLDKNSKPIQIINPIPFPLTRSCSTSILNSLRPGEVYPCDTIAKAEEFYAASKHI